VIKAPDPHGMVPTSTPDIYKVIENFQLSCGWAVGPIIMPLPLIHVSQI
jgi:hypothetical protein